MLCKFRTLAFAGLLLFPAQSTGTNFPPSLPPLRTLPLPPPAQFGDTALHEACRWGHLEVARLLIDHNADLAATNQHGWTPMHFAAAYGQLEVVRLLLESGADVSAKDNVRGHPPSQRISCTSHRKPLHRHSFNGCSGVPHVSQ